MVISLGLELFLKNDPILINSKKKFDTIGPYNVTTNGLEIFVAPGDEWVAVLSG
jgi:hypothetical protein